VKVFAEGAAPGVGAAHSAWPNRNTFRRRRSVAKADVAYLHTANYDLFDLKPERTDITTHLPAMNDMSAGSSGRAHCLLVHKATAPFALRRAG